MIDEICCCNHPKNCHENKGVFDGWGDGACDKCMCKSFLDNNWKQIEKDKHKAFLEYYSKHNIVCNEEVKVSWSKTTLSKNI